MTRRAVRELLGRLLLVAVSAGLTLLAGEVVVRLLFPGEAPLFVDIYRVDEHGLLGLRPGATRRHSAREWDVTISISAEGLRDRDIPVPSDGCSVLAPGDSFAFGWGVEVEETFLYRAEEALRPVGIRIVKAGIPGTGTGDHLDWLRAHGDRHAPKGPSAGNRTVESGSDGTRPMALGVCQDSPRGPARGDRPSRLADARAPGRVS